MTEKEVAKLSAIITSKHSLINCLTIRKKIVGKYSYFLHKVKYSLGPIAIKRGTLITIPMQR